MTMQPTDKITIHICPKPQPPDGECLICGKTPPGWEVKKLAVVICHWCRFAGWSPPFQMRRLDLLELLGNNTLQLQGLKYLSEAAKQLPPPETPGN